MMLEEATLAVQADSRQRILHISTRVVASPQKPYTYVGEMVFAVSPNFKMMRPV